ncbi:unnamed protein product [Peniophora sp. CBMAI 1063]|nr:unnamed protein product [Peniophora sp. CBMAI 1063]
MLYQALSKGIPVKVSGIHPGDRNLTPEYFTHNHGDTIVTLTNTKTGVQRKVALKSFMDEFAKPPDPDNPEKLQVRHRIASITSTTLNSDVKDWPPTADFSVKFPEIFGIFEDCLVGPWITSRRGPLNLETNMPIGSCPPDTGPKAYLAHGAAGGTTTRLHTDMTDATNILFHEEEAEEGAEGGALWIMIDRDDMSLAADLLRTWKHGSFGKGHPIHSQQLILTEQDVQALKDAGVRVWTLVQKQGDAVFIPAGVGHQVTNLTPCIKIAVDFVVPSNIDYSDGISAQLREHRLACEDRDSEDVLQLAAMCWWTYKRWQVENLADTRSDPESEPWTSSYSAAPLYMPVNKKNSGDPDDRGMMVDNPGPDVGEIDKNSSCDPDDRGMMVDSPGPDVAEIPISQNPISDPSPDITPLGPEPSMPSAQHDGSTAPLIPSKRRISDEPLSRTQKRRLKKARSVQAKSLLDAAKTLACPLGGCKRAAHKFKREDLLNHLESAHRERVGFLHSGKPNLDLVNERKMILGKHPQNDPAFGKYLLDEILSKHA